MVRVHEEVAVVGQQRKHRATQVPVQRQRHVALARRRLQGRGDKYLVTGVWSDFVCFF